MNLILHIHRITSQTIGISLIAIAITCYVVQLEHVSITRHIGEIYQREMNLEQTRSAADLQTLVTKYIPSEAHAG